MEYEPDFLGCLIRKLFGFEIKFHGLYEIFRPKCNAVRHSDPLIDPSPKWRPKIQISQN